jgi:hypothetical protein
MATQRYRHKTDRTVGENESSPTRATHPARPELEVKPGGENRTPAPVAAPSTTADQARSTSWGRDSGGPGGNPGKNGFGGPSSLNPGERAGAATINPQAPTDAVLDAVIRGGAHGAQVSDDWQTRDLSDPHDNKHGRPPVHPAMASRAADSGSPGGTVPATTGAPVSAPVRQPGK